MQLQSADFWWISALALAAPFPYRDCFTERRRVFATHAVQAEDFYSPCAHPDIPDFVTTNRHFRKFFQGAKEIPGDFSFLSVQ
jgi:hypothetical protein